MGPAGRGRRLTYVSAHDPADGQGGRVHIDAVVAALRQRGWRVRLVEPRRSSPSALVRLLRLVPLQLRALTAGRLYARHHPALLFVVVASRLLGATVVVEVNGTVADLLDAHPGWRRIAPWIRWLDRRVLRAATAVVAVSDELAAHVRATAGVDAVVVPNGVDTDVVHPIAGQRRHRVVFLGSLSPWQGIHDLLQAVDDPAWPADVTLTIGGVGPLVDEVLANARVEYRGIVAREEVPHVLAQALAVVSPKTPAHAGASPLKVYEAMAAGVPVIASDVGQQAQVVRHADCGLVVDGDPSSIARAVARLHDDPTSASAMGERGRSAVEREHSWRRRAAQLDAVLRGAAGMPPVGLGDESPMRRG